MTLRSFTSAGLQLNVYAEWSEPALKIPKMLFGQDFGGGHQGDIEIAFEGHQRGTGGDDGFAGADVALEQTAHGVGAAQVGADIAQDAGLGVRQLEAESGEEGFDEMVVAAAGKGLCVGFEFFPALSDLKLEGDKFIQGQTAAGDFDVRKVLRELDHADGIGAGG